MKFIFFVLILISNTSWANFDETKIQIPLKDSNEEKLLPMVCRTNENNLWDLCLSMIDTNHETPNSFKLINLGDNNTVPHSGNMIGREFTFMFQDMARSDLELLVWDIPDENTNHGHLKMMMFFPRKILPAIRFNSEKNTLIVTLPTREEVIFNAETKEILSGALKEAPMEQDNAGNAISPLVSYTGTGVVIEAHRLNEYPVGSIKNMATIKKIGHEDCLVPVKELWFTDENKGGNVYFNKNFITDFAFDHFIKSRCKFSIY
jgi:hypothetical protein